MTVKINYPLIIILAAATRFVFFIAFAPWEEFVEQHHVLQSDGLGFHRLALALLFDGRFAVPDNLHLGTVRTPLYPAFIALCYAIFGIKPWVVLLIQVGLDVATTVLIAITAARIYPRAANWAGILYALNPVAIFYASTLLSDTLFTFQMTALFWLLSRPIEWKRAVGAGLMIGLLALNRPIAVYLPAVIALWLVVSARRQALVPSVLLIAGFAVIVTPWLAHNHLVYGHARLSTSSDYNLLVLTAGRMEAARHNVTPSVSKDRLIEEAEAMAARDGVDLDRANPFDIAPYQRQLAVEIITGDVAGFARVYAFGILRMVANLNTRGVGQALGWETPVLDVTGAAGVGDHLQAQLARSGWRELTTAALVAIYMMLSYTLTLIGILLWRGRPDRMLWLCATLTAYFVVLTGAAGLARFLLPAVPFYLVFAGIGGAYVTDVLRSRRLGALRTDRAENLPHGGGLQ